MMSGLDTYINSVLRQLLIRILNYILSIPIAEWNSYGIQVLNVLMYVMTIITIKMMDKLDQCVF
jgi:hypothetical protein